MRAFVSLDIIDEKVIGSLVSLQKELLKTQADIKPVAKENLHFTLKFLGEIDEPQLSEVDKRLKALGLNEIEVLIKGIGVFPNIRHFTVIWAGVANEDQSKIRNIADTVIKALEGIGHEEGGPFQAHVTIARVKSGRNKELLLSLINKYADHIFGTVKIDSIKLKKSELTPKGPIYTDIGVYRLR